MPDPEFTLVFSRALGAVVVHIHGALDASSGPTVKDRLVDLIDDQGNRQVVLDLRETSGIDFAGQSVLLDALERMHHQGGELLLSGPNSRVADALRAAGLDDAFVITPEWTHPARGGRSARRQWEHERA